MAVNLIADQQKEVDFVRVTDEIKKKHLNEIE